MSQLDITLDKIADICHESYTGCAKTSDPVASLAVAKVRKLALERTGTLQWPE